MSQVVERQVHLLEHWSRIIQ